MALESFVIFPYFMNDDVSKSIDIAPEILFIGPGKKY